MQGGGGFIILCSTQSNAGPLNREQRWRIILGAPPTPPSPHPALSLPPFLLRWMSAIHLSAVSISETSPELSPAWPRRWEAPVLQLQGHHQSKTNALAGAGWVESSCRYEGRRMPTTRAVPAPTRIALLGIIPAILDGFSFSLLIKASKP